MQPGIAVWQSRAALALDPADIAEHQPSKEQQYTLEPQFIHDGPVVSADQYKEIGKTTHEKDLAHTCPGQAFCLLLPAHKLCRLLARSARGRCAKCIWQV